MASTIKVDNVQNQPGTNIINKCSVTTTIGAGAGDTVNVCAATVNIGRCGGTVALAAGATQTGFGRTGTVDWITTPKVTGDSPITAVSGNGYFLNTTAGTITVNLPAGAAGSIVSMADYAATWQTNNVTVNANGTEKIGGVASSPVTLSTEGQSVTLVYVDSTQGWVNTMDSTSNVRGSAFISATVSGACNTLATAPDCANTKIATFLGPGTFCVSATSGCAANNLVSYMVVAGGGGSGGDLAGGGGAGGFREYKSPVTPYTASPLDGNPGGTAVTVSATPYPIGIGGAGARGTTPSGIVEGCRGSPSTFSTITSTGGGAGMVRTASETGPPAPAKSPGGSGGGGSYNNGASGTGNTPTVSPAQGTNGGTTPGSNDAGAGGGGGATVAGGAGAGPTATQGADGAGATTSISATPTAYAGGGGGGAWSAPSSGGAGGAGGGGAGGGAGSPGTHPGTSGLDNTGGGGGGGNASGAAIGGAGGSGIIIIRYKFQ